MRINIKAMALLVASAVSVAGCETLNETLGDNELIAAATAGLGCAAISKLTGGDDKQVAAALVVCGTLGYAVTRKLEDDRKQYATNEEFYAAEAERLQQYDANLNSQIKTSQSELAATQSQIKKVVAKANRSEAEQKSLTAINNELKSRETRLRQELDVANDNLKYRKGLNLHMEESEGAVTPDAEKQLAALESSIQELSQLVSAHEEQSASLGTYL